MAQGYMGASIKRREDVRFLTGHATYVDDIQLPHLRHAAILRSPHAHARVLAIHTAAALAIPGVDAVFTYADIAPQAQTIPLRLYPLPGLDQFLQYPLAHEKVLYVGEPVAVVVACSRYVAEDALDAIEVEYEPLPALVDVHQALQDDVILHERQQTNLANRYTVSIGDLEAAWREADHTRRETLAVHRHTGNPLETRGLIAQYDIGRRSLTVWGPTKVPHFNRAILAKMLDMPEDTIHFIEPDVGGGFGIRGEFYPEDFLIPFVAMRVGSPVKWIEDRLEHLKSANHSRQVSCEMEIAVKRDGTLLGMRAHIYGDMGAYVRTHGGLVPASTAYLLTGPYRIPAFEVTVSCVMTNKMGLGTYRAPGRYESCFMRERLLDMIAGDLGIDGVELRQRNFIQPDAIPYHLGDTRPGFGPTIFECGDFPAALQCVLERIDYAALKPLQGTYRDGKYHGIGVGCFIKGTGLGPYEGARIVIGDEGRVSVYLGIATMGQGHETSMAQICADCLDVPFENIAIYHGNTDFIPYGVGTFGSRGTVMGGSAIYLAAQQLKDKILAVASRYLDTTADRLTFRQGHIYRQGDEQPALDLSTLAQLARPDSPYAPDTPGLDVTAYFNCTQPTHSYGVHAVHLAVDAETGLIDILRYVMSEDVGRCINPLIVQGQAVGAAVQGIGGTLLEELVYGENGQLLSGTLMDYALPTSHEAPVIEDIILEDTPSPLNPLGVKGAGEGGIVATGAALANAVSHALASFGVQVTDLPLSPSRIRELIMSHS
jgi:carbon-monoxide dehydrogenase large subunit